jgi:hypothetical protein
MRLEVTASNAVLVDNSRDQASERWMRGGVYQVLMLWFVASASVRSARLNPGSNTVLYR